MQLETIESFTGEYDFLSNFYPVPIEYEGITYPSVEHAFQAAKTDDLVEKLKILNAPSPGKAKRLGKKVRLRKNWEKEKVKIMITLLLIKFPPESPLTEKLRETRFKILIEKNTWGDVFWGVCGGRGLNKLGECLMLCRDIRRKVEDIFPEILQKEREQK